MATNVDTLGCVYGAGDNTAAFQAAVNLGIPLEISDNLYCAGSISVNNTGTTIEGIGTLEVPLTTIYRIGIGGIKDITHKGSVNFPATADVRNVQFLRIKSQRGPWKWRYGCLTSGMVVSDWDIDEVDAYPTAEGYLTGCLNGATVELCSVTATRYSSTGAGHGFFAFSGSYNNIRYNDFIDIGFTDNISFANAINFGAVLGSIEYALLPTCRGNKIYGNTIFDGREERIVYDGFAGNNSAKIGYVSSIVNQTVTISLTRDQQQGLTYPSNYSGFDLAVLVGGNPGRTYKIESGSGDTFLLEDVPSLLQVGDFVSIGSYFIDNEIYDNTISGTEGVGVECGSGIVLAFGVYGNYVHDNTLNIPDGEYAAGPQGQWFIPRCGIGCQGLIYSYDSPPGNVTVNNTQYSGSGYNRILNNTVNLNKQAQFRIDVVFNKDSYTSGGGSEDFHLSYLPAGMPAAYSYGNTMEYNQAQHRGADAGSIIYDQRDMIYQYNLLPLELQMTWYTLLGTGPNTFAIYSPPPVDVVVTPLSAWMRMVSVPPTIPGTDLVLTPSPAFQVMRSVAPYVDISGGTVVPDWAARMEKVGLSRFANAWAAMYWPLAPNFIQPAPAWMVMSAVDPVVLPGFLFNYWTARNEMVGLSRLGNRWAPMWWPMHNPGTPIRKCIARTRTPHYVPN